METSQKTLVAFQVGNQDRNHGSIAQSTRLLSDYALLVSNCA